VIATSSLLAGQPQVPYAAQLGATGGTAPYVWSVSSANLPGGLTLSSTGAISGTPTQSGNFSFSVSVMDSSSSPESASRVFSINIAAGTAKSILQITTSSLPAGQVQAPYAAQLGATGGTAPYSWSVSSGSLPAGSTLSNTGAISGTPTQSGNFSFSVSVTDSSSSPQSASHAFSITITAATPTLLITTSSLPAGQVQAPYTAQLGATGGTAAYSWSVSSANLPTGLTLSSTGAVSGTPAQSGNFSFSVSVKDTSSSPQTASRAFSINIVAATPTLQITTNSLPAGQVQAPYTAQLSSTGGTAPDSWSVSSANLPAGLTLSSTGAISGTPTQSGNIPFSLSVKDSSSSPQTASHPFSINVTATTPTLQITTASLLVGQVQATYTAQLSSTGGTAPDSWSVSSGSLPAGLTLSSTGAISGTPTQSGTVSFSVSVKDSSSSPQTASRAFGINISAATPTLQITSSSLPAGQVQATYTAQLSAAGGTPTYNWSAIGGSLPPGLTLNASGSITGAPTQAGAFSVTIQVRDSLASPQTAAQAFSVTISPLPLQITTSSVPSGVVSVSYNATLAAANGVPPYAWSVNGGQFPPGLSLQGSTGQISGTPSQSSTFSFSIQARDSAGKTASSNFNVNIGLASPPVVSSISPASGPTSGGTPVMIAGSNFQAGANVLFGGIAATSTTVNSAIQIQAVTPAHIAGTIDVTVRNADGQSSTLSSGFTYNVPLPTVTSASPSTGPTGVATTVTITGTNFQSGAVVLFGTVSASTVTVTNATQIQAVTPANPAGAVNVTVRNPDGQTTTLTGGFDYLTPLQGQLTANPSSVDLGNVLVGSRGSQTITLMNRGTANVTISAASASGTGFTISGLTIPAAISTGANTAFTVQFSPILTGNVSGSILISSDAPGSPLTIVLSGAGVQPQLSARSATVSFGNVVLGNSNSQTIRLSNTGSASVAISQATVAGTGFSISGIAVPLSLPAGQSNTFNAVFSPGSTGSDSGSVSLASDAPNSPLTIALSGSGVAATQILVANPTTLSFGNVSMGNAITLDVTLTNSGNSNVTISNVTTTGAGFSASGVSGGTTLTPNQTVTLSVAFAPTTTGNSSGSVAVSSSSTGSPATITLSAASHAADLIWAASASSGVTGYRVYRGVVSGGPYTILNSSPISPITYSDPTVGSGQTYYYVVTAVDSSDVESAYSNEASAIVPTP
jgi:hypothetical protein